MIRKIAHEQPHRLPREYYHGQIWASFTICVKGEGILFTDCEVVAQFVSILDWARKRNDCVILIYCFMPDHLHLVLQGQSEQSDLYKAMLDFKQRAGFYLSQTQCSCHLQKDFHDHIIRSEKDLAAQLRYIAENPERCGLVTCWQEYPFTGVLGIDMDSVVNAMLDFSS